ncbi:MAG: VCBS repeat-containing protein [Planctomycetota bacterium]
MPTFVPLLLLAPLAQDCPSEVVHVELDAGVAGPLLSAPDGAPVIGGPFSLLVDGGPASSPGVLALGLAETPTFLPQLGAVLYPSLPFLSFPFATDASGASPALLAFGALDPALCGTVLIFQAAVLDASAPGGARVSNGLRMRGGDVRSSFLPAAAFVDGAPRGFDAGDWDGDGVVDLVAANASNLAWLRGLGEDRFAPEVVIPASGDPAAVLGADFDGDGLLDLATASASSPFAAADLFVFGGGGDGTFGPEVPSAASADGPDDLRAADFDLDGDLDLALYAVDANETIVLLGAGDLSFPTRMLLDAPSTGDGIAVGDVDADGAPDIVAGSQGADAVRLFPGAGDGTFLPALTVGGFSQPRDVELADLDGDGTEDLIVLQGVPASVATSLGTGDGTFAAPSAQPFTGVPTGLATGDFDGDGAPDAAAQTFNDGAVILLGAGDGTLGAAAVRRTFAGPSAFGALDANGDGNLDLGLTASGVFGVQLLLGDGEGGFGSWESFPAGDVVAEHLAGVDLNQDGAIDLVSTLGGPGQAVLGVLLGAGDGTFADPTETGLLPGLVRHLATGDVTGDGIPDVVTTQSNNFAVRQTAGGGALGAAVVTTLGPGVAATDFALGDLDGDGRADAAAAIFDRVSVLLAQADGTFAAPLAGPPLPGIALAVTLADLDLDGQLDAAATSSPGNVSALLGLGNGGLGAPESFAVGSTPLDVQAGDLDLDGVPDLVTADSDSDSASVLLGLGAGLFSPSAAVATAPDPQALRIADLDGDGAPDLLLACNNADLLQLLPGAGDGTFEAPRYFAAAASPTALVTAQLDGDGNLDVAVGQDTADEGVVVLISSIGE